MGDYQFLMLKDAITCINQKVNLFAVILDFTLPQRTKGTDYFCKLKVIDESHSEFWVPVHVFAQEIDGLPLVASVGDIIQLSRVTMTVHEGDVYAIFNNKFSSFALYDGKDGDNFHPYKVSLRFHEREHDEKIIASMRKWLASSEVIDVPNFSLLREIDRVVCVNLACKVLHISKTTNDKWMVFLWDGTDAPPISIYNKLEDELHNPLPLHFEPLPPSRDVLCTFPTVGTILRVILDVDCVTYILQLLKVDQWMKFFHVFCKMHDGLWYGVFTSSSMIRDMPNDDILIFERQSNCDQRSLGELDRMPYWSCPWPSKITEVKRIDVPFSTLMDVLTCKKETNNFRCVVRFVAVIPWRVEDFRAPCGAYRVRFTLEDPTARIHAYAHAENGEEFFNCSSSDALKRKVIKLLGVPVSRDGEAIMGGARNPPWVQCYLKSNPIKQRHWIFETKLLG
ncbi:hypothetical protein ERO13_D12G193100v2 [Gossypium hirsutum]|uniref:Protection of telomeres protein 1b isoform X1 n=4 Tax=Gossypium TaxID=3633 RepID=A0A1U8KA31_GOSHI|nr:protection of telomeres protein 1b-like isoform X1 [Gossypium hirsutum]KAB2000191.1 hypothetical protein ES319_D12G215500v1 [Gossypium barbadense]KAG4116853.1 hypothetical protein ERO13_D12G193100v2 [Gossypium hirsutum]PPD91495.1 hypothetical protein GOBAR_DD11574 [Gossypium barbadense]TYG42065.1 hypothetical protein ES288_D12G226900v1 [Gossypium darwinii]